MSPHEFYMQRCLSLAALGAGRTAPNPLVGAVLVHEGRIIGEGYHDLYGGPHAEVNCLSSVQENDRRLIHQSTLYVSLEPCVHFGKTPPCTDLILSEKIPTVVIGCADTFSEVSGRGIEKLRAAGVEVVTDVLYNECREINRRFFCFHEKKRPYIFLKWAQSADGKIGLPDGRVAISGAATNRLVHRWRSEEAAIFVGGRTIQTDDPQLTVRHWRGPNPVRISFDEHGSFDPASKIFDDSARSLILYSAGTASATHTRGFEMKANETFTEGFVRCLVEQNLLSVMVEGGPNTLQRFIDAGLWDFACVITNPGLTIPGGTAAPVLQDAECVHEESLGTDQLTYFVRRF